MPDNELPVLKAFIARKFDASFQHLKNCCSSNILGCPIVEIYVVSRVFVTHQRPMVTAEYIVAVLLIGDGDVRRG